MKHLFLIFIIAILASAFSNDLFQSKYCQNETGKVLLIRYNQDTDFKVLKDFLRRSKRYFYIPSQPISGPEYDLSKKELYIGKPIKVSDSSKILFIEGNDITGISLPFHFSYITLDSLLNDSVIQITFNNKQHILESGQIFTDTTTWIEKTNRRVIQYYRIIEIQNYGLMLTKNIFTENERMLKMDEELRIRDSIDLYDLNELEKKK